MMHSFTWFRSSMPARFTASRTTMAPSSVAFRVRERSLELANRRANSGNDHYVIGLVFIRTGSSEDRRRLQTLHYKMAERESAGPPLHHPTVMDVWEYRMLSGRREVQSDSQPPCRKPTAEQADCSALAHLTGLVPALVFAGHPEPYSRCHACRARVLHLTIRNGMGRWWATSCGALRLAKRTRSAI